MARARAASIVALLLTAGCHASQPGQALEPSPPESADAFEHRELAMRYAMGLSLFDRGEYEAAAAVFTQVLLELPRDQSGDVLRHALIQHIAWSLLGSHDLSGDVTALDRGEAMLERYLERHESLFPKADGERVVIYELLGEYQLRRDGQPPPDANGRLLELVEHTQASFLATPSRKRAPHVIDNGPVRIIEVDKIPWGRRDDPEVAAYFSNQRPDMLGPSLYDKPGDPLNPTRVLVRGLVRDVNQQRDRGRAYELLRAARPAAEQCYESALGRGAELVERVSLDITWDTAGLDVEFVGQHFLDPAAVSCVRAALRTADRSLESEPTHAHAQLRLTFFVQFERAGPGKVQLDTNRFGFGGLRNKGVPWLEL